MPTWIAPAVMLFGIIVSPIAAYVAFRISFERFLAKDTEREKHWMRWQDSVSHDVEELKSERNFHVRIQQCEDFIGELRDWKHERVDPHIRALGQLKEQVDRLEKRP